MPVPDNGEAGVGPGIGLLPCNVVVREDDDGVVSVAFMDPKTVLAWVEKPGIDALAADVRARLWSAHEVWTADG